MQQAFARARELCDQLGPEALASSFPAMAGLHRYYFASGNPRVARDLGEQLLRQADARGDDGLRLAAHWMVGTPLVWLGEGAAAHRHLSAGIALHDAARHGALALTFGFDPGASARVYDALALWWLGYPDQALARAEEAVAVARERGHAFSIGYALVCLAIVDELRGDVVATLRDAEATVELAATYGFRPWWAAGIFSRGWALGAQGDRDQGIAQMREGSGTYRALGMGIGVTRLLVSLAETLGGAGQPGDGLALIAEARGLVERIGETYVEAEIHRVEGELRLRIQPSAVDEGAACFDRALQVARRQGARSFELRAATSLARVRLQRDRRAEARTLLEPVYGWFTEGFDAEDLVAARALLSEIS